LKQGLTVDILQLR